MDLKSIVTLDSVVNAYSYMGYTYCTSGDYNLNIFGIRNQDNKDSNNFNDVIGVTFMVKGTWYLRVYGATTDPGVTSRVTPINSNGCAILIPGQYKGCYQIGMHQGKYEALTQRKPMNYWRDNNKDQVLDFASKVYTEIAGTNLHRATAIPGVTSKIVDNYSAGCQVIAAYNDWTEFMGFVHKSVNLYGNAFTYTLFTQNNFLCKNKSLS